MAATNLGLFFPPRTSAVLMGIQTPPEESTLERFRIAQLVAMPEHSSKSAAVQGWKISQGSRYSIWFKFSELNTFSKVVLWEHCRYRSEGVCDSSTSLDIRIFCHHEHVRDDHIIGAAKFDILKSVRGEDIEIDLFNLGTANGTKKKWHTRITLHLKVAILASFSNDAASDLGSPMKFMEMIGLANYPTPQQFRQISPVWKRFVVSLNTFCKLAEAIAELSPKAKVAVGAVGFALKIMIDQINRDEKIMGLIAIMTDLYQFFLDADPMQKILTFRKTVDRLLSQTTECSYFIADYLKTIYAVSNADSMIQQFEGAFGNLKIELILGTSLQVAVVSFRVLDKVKNIVNLMLIDHLPYSKSAGWDLGRTCLRGTRDIIIDEVVHWASDSERSRVYLLFGSPGCGKSAIAHTIAHTFHQQGRLGAGVFLDSRCVDREANSQTITNTVAFQLASYDPRIGERMAEKLSSGNLLASADTERQFPELIISAIEDLAMVGPTVIIIDGLPDLVEQRRLLTTIIKSTARLPPNIRIVLTSRPDSIIPLIMDDQTSLVRTQEIGFHDESEVALDVFSSNHFVELCLDHHIFCKDSNLSEEYNREEVHEQFMRQALGMDFWISTAYRMLSRCNNIEKRTILNIIRAQTLPQSKLEAMDNIYHAFLTILPYPPQFALSIFAALINSPKPIELPKASLLGMVVVERSVDSQGSPLLGLHLCFEDLLSDLWRLGSNKDQYYYCDRQKLSVPHAGELSLDEMNRSLNHNLLELEDITVLNDEVLGLSDRISKFLPERLQYACCNWAIHIEAVKDPTAVSSALREFLFNHLLHWFEVMSFLGLFDIVLPSLERLYNWLKKHAPLEYELCQLTANGIRFIQLFSPIISQAALQTYVSALPLMPADTLLFEQYHDEPIADRSNLTSCIYYAQWSVQPMPAQAHLIKKGDLDFQPSVLSPVAYHGSLIATFSKSHGISFYDLWNGNVHPKIDVGPNTIHEIVFSPDGRHIAATGITNRQNNGVIGIWEVSTGRCVHSVEVWPDQPVISYSADGTKIVVSGQYPRRISVWDSSGRPIRSFSTTSSSALSGNCLALLNNSEDNITIQLLKVDVRSKAQFTAGVDEAIVEEFKIPVPHQDMLHPEYRELLWSSDGRILAVFIDEVTIYLRSFGNVATRTLILHFGKNSKTLKSRVTLQWPYCRRLAFSSDSLYLAAIQRFQTEQYRDYGLVSIWDTNTGELLFQKELSLSLRCNPSLSFLPDSHEIIIHRGPSGIPPPIHLVNFSDSPDSPQSEPAPTIAYSHLLSRNAKGEGDYAPQVGSDGWIINRKGARQMWVPYPNYKVSSIHWPYVEGEEPRCCLEIRHPDTEKVVLRFNINFGSTRGTEAGEPYARIGATGNV
ncbi:hypothetical protein GALMADRAFT_216918 [Galerina marginata CBS 339.88]|uniref:NACHT domain-containing protein n=1 Tax=Galerina marginata (strain CBS 339.88) TaxID=685588 RepID=A0A067S9A3_GALM3|nr:hypothetical protein GALMADRAFT_216918 [Galerina marginata CBS 339.88]